MEDHRSGLGPLDDAARVDPGVTRAAHKAAASSSPPVGESPVVEGQGGEEEARKAAFRGLETLLRLVKAAWPSSRDRSIAVKALEDAELRLRRAPTEPTR